MINWHQLESNWNHFTDKVNEKWDKITKAEVINIAGRREQLALLLQQHYGISKEQAEQDADEFAKTLIK